MTISAALVKELRERTGAGMMDCKKALTQTGGNIDQGIELLRTLGVASAEKKSGRIAAEGVIVQLVSGDKFSGVLVEVNCETDFAAKDNSFKEYSTAVALCLLAGDQNTIEDLEESELHPGISVNQARQELISKIGENISVRRFDRLRSPDGLVAGYLHGGRIGVLVSMDKREAELGKDIAMHIAASRPICVAEDDVPEEVIEAERSIFTAQAKESGKSDDIVARMVDGKLKKFMKENTLLGQAYVKDPDITVGDLIAGVDAKVCEMLRYEVGEGLDKRDDDFVAEVMAQASRG
jgi:elongation factor Ts|tara:strand:+ start:778 stop:1659 length:882 start_codon:yes stop_codon:yes gene_type:complete